MRSKGYMCYNYWCNGRVLDSPLCGESGDTALSCRNRIVSTKTNADRIRDMNDEELNDFLGEVENCIGKCPYSFGTKKSFNWLQQPPKEYENG